MEFAHMLVQQQGDARIADLLARERIVILPLVNPDGFVSSRGAFDPGDALGQNPDVTLVEAIAPFGGLFAYRRKNCDGEISRRRCRASSPGASTPTATTATTGAARAARRTSPRRATTAPARARSPRSRRSGTSSARTRSRRYSRSTTSPRSSCARPARAAPASRPTRRGSRRSATRWARRPATRRSTASSSTTRAARPRTTPTRRPAASATRSRWARRTATSTCPTRPASSPSGPARTPHSQNRGGLQEALLDRRRRAAADPPTTRSCAAPRPPGKVLRLHKRFETKTSPYCAKGIEPIVNIGLAAICLTGQQPPLTLDDELDATTTVPASGAYEWHIGPSTRPFVAAAGRGGLHADLRAARRHGARAAVARHRPRPDGGAEPRLRRRRDDVRRRLARSAATRRRRRARRRRRRSTASRCRRPRPPSRAEEAKPKTRAQKLASCNRQGQPLKRPRSARPRARRARSATAARRRGPAAADGRPVADRRGPPRAARASGRHRGSARFGGVVFALGRRELGHLHGETVADLPLHRSSATSSSPAVGCRPPSSLPTARG